MTKTIIDVFNDLFGEVFNDDFLAKLEKESKDVKDSENEKKDVDDYYHLVKDEYEDGVHTYHKEKEVINGKVTKDEAFATLPDKKEECDKKKCVCDSKHKCEKNKEDEVQFELEVEDKNCKSSDKFVELEKQLKEIREENKVLKEAFEQMKKELKEKEQEKKYLQAKLNVIKNCF